MKYIDADKLKAEIERLRKLVVEDNYYLDNYEQALGYGLALDDMGQFFDTFSEEPDKSLEEKTCKGFEEEFRRFIKKEKEKEPDKSLPYYGDYGIYRVARHFAQWGAEHAPLPEDTVIFNKGVAEGKRLMLEDAVECSVWAGKEGDKWIVSYIGNYESMLKTCKGGDKVRIIIVNEEKNGQSD